MKRSGVCHGSDGSTLLKNIGLSMESAGLYAGRRVASRSGDNAVRIGTLARSGMRNSGNRSEATGIRLCWLKLARRAGSQA